MAVREKKHKRRRLVSGIRSQPWAITDDALATMAQLLQVDEAGHLLSPATVNARLGLGEERRSQVTLAGSTALVPLFGVIQPKANAMTRWTGGTGLDAFLADVDEALRNEQVKQIVIIVDSPGGSAQGNEEAAAMIYAARSRKPIIALAEGLMGSAAYYVGSAAGKVYATPSSMIGSIGTIAFHQDASQFWAEYGIKWTPISFGRHKADANAVQPLTDQGKQTIQEFVDAFGSQFVAAVARNRSVTTKDVMDRFGQGKVFLAAEAQERGMIDGTVNDLDELIEQLTGATASAANIVTLQRGWSQMDKKEYAAGAAAVSSGFKPTAATAATSQESDDMTKRIKAALYALGLIDEIDAGDEVCTAALKAFCKARGVEYDGQANEATILTLLSAPPANQAAGKEGSAENKEGKEATDNVQAAHQREVDEAKQEAARNERERAKQIRASAKLLDMGAEAVQAAIDSGKSHAEVIEGWHADLVKKEEGVTPGADIRQTGSSIDAFNAAAVEALLDRFQMRNAEEKPPAGFNDLQRAPMLFLAQESLRLNGQAVGRHADAEETALRFLQLDAGVHTFNAMGAAVNRPADFPNLLSALSGKMLDQALELAQPTYPIWTARMGDVADFKPKTIIGVGRFDELDLILDDAPVGERQLEEEMVGWIQADRYANAVGITPVMVANDDLDGFTEGVMSLAEAHEMTLNRLCVALIGGNVTLVDGNALYDTTNHLNEVASGSGGVPSITQMNLQREAHWSQTGIGGKGKVRTPAAVALVPTTLQTEAEQVFEPFAVFNETKVAATDATLNVYRGKIRPVVEPELDGYSTTQWYTFADPRRRRTIAHAFMRGYGRGGRRTTWFEPSRETRYVKLEGRFGAAVASYRGTVRNYGA